MLEDDDGNLRILIHPELRTVVTENDLPYIHSLLQDIQERAKRQPDALFKQLSSLGVGPLLTHEAGTNVSEYPIIQQLSTQYIPLHVALKDPENLFQS